MKTDREKMKMLEKTLKTNLSKRVKFIEPKKKHPRHKNNETKFFER